MPSQPYSSVTYPGSPSAVNHMQGDPRLLAADALRRQGFRPTTKNIEKLIRLAEKHREQTNRTMPSNKSLGQAITEMARKIREQRGGVKKEMTSNERQNADTILENLDAFEVSLVPKAANKRKFLILKADEAPREKKMSYEEIESMAKDLVTKSAEPLSIAQGVSRLMEQRPELYEPMTVEMEYAPQAPSTAAQTCAVFKAAHEDSGEVNFTEFVSKVFRERPELAAAWYEGSMDNADD